MVSNIHAERVHLPSRWLMLRPFSHLHLQVGEPNHFGFRVDDLNTFVMAWPASSEDKLPFSESLLNDYFSFSSLLIVVKIIISSALTIKSVAKNRKKYEVEKVKRNTVSFILFGRRFQGDFRILQHVIHKKMTNRIGVGMYKNAPNKKPRIWD